jgi:hypothetical protein
MEQNLKNYESELCTFRCASESINELYHDFMEMLQGMFMYDLISCDEYTYYCSGANALYNDYKCFLCESCEDNYTEEFLPFN